MLAHDCFSAGGLINGEKRNPLEFYSRENAPVRIINLSSIDAIAVPFLNIETAG